MSVRSYLGSVSADPRDGKPLFCGQDADGFYVACGGREVSEEVSAADYVQVALILPGFAPSRYPRRRTSHPAAIVSSFAAIAVAAAIR